jgi:type VI secretion system lysozyme-like protein
MKKSIQQDVMELLNTKLNVFDVSENMELYDSILTFGLPDMVTLTGSSDDQARSMARHVQDILTRFEPRLARIRVIANPQGRDSDRREVKFHVEAVLNIEPYRDFVGFETILELTTGRAKVSVRARRVPPAQQASMPSPSLAGSPGQS